MGKSLGYYVGAGMMQGLGAGIIENAKAQREAALKKMEIDAHAAESASSDAERAALTDKEIASREGISNAEIGMRGKEADARLKEAEASRLGTEQYRKDQLRIDEDYKRGMVSNTADRTDKVRDPNKLTAREAIELIQKDALTAATTEKLGIKDVNKDLYKKALAEGAARYADMPEVAKHFGIQSQAGGAAPAPAFGSGMQAPAAGVKAPDTTKKFLERDAIKADFRSGAISKEEANRRLAALDAQ